MEKKVVVITGGAGCIGEAIARRFADDSNTVVLADVNLQAAEKAASGIGHLAKAFQVDVSSRQSVEKMFSVIESEIAPVDILVNNAGVSEVVPFLELDDAAWDRHIDINLKGTFLCSQAALKSMVKRNFGKIINMSSQSGKRGSRQYEAYCASKFGIIGLTQSMADEFAPYKININAVCPGIVWSGLWEKMAPDYAAKRGISVDEVKDFLVSRIPLGRLCKPEDVANVVAFLASKEAAYMTGQAINVTGGAVTH